MESVGVSLPFLVIFLAATAMIDVEVFGVLLCECMDGVDEIPEKETSKAIRKVTRLQCASNRG